MVDTLPVLCFGGATDEQGVIWCAGAGTDSVIRVYNSSDLGRTWSTVLSSDVGDSVRRIEVLCGPGQGAYVYVFVLAAANRGDLKVLRLNGQEDRADVFNLAVGPDTIDDFSVCCDRDRRYYLYCLYANERRGGRNAVFTRSQDFGESWDPGQGWWNCWDPHIAFGGGSTIHCAWRYSGTGREIHFQSSRYYGRVRTWSGVRVVSGRTQKCWDPVVAQSDTGKEWEGTVWVCYTAAERDTVRQYVGRSFSRDGGESWNTLPVKGSPLLDEWFADLAAFPGSPSGYVYLCHNAGGKGRYDNTTVRLSAANSYLPDRWSKPLAMNDARSSARLEGCRPRVVCPAGAPRGWAGVLFSPEADGFGAGICFDAMWNERETTGGEPRNTGPEVQSSELLRCEPNPFTEKTAFRLPLTAGGPGETAIYDASGRCIRVLTLGRLLSAVGSVVWDGRDEQGRPVPPGAYFLRPTGLPPVRVVKMGGR